MVKEDLKIGDWVEYVGDRLPYKVVEIRQNKVIMVRTGNTNHAGYDKINPIPLTEKILLDNGWKQFKIYYHEFSLNRFLVSNRGGYFSVSILDSVGESTLTYITNIYYVHELQHILWAHNTGFDTINIASQEPIVNWKVFQLQLTLKGINKETNNPQYIVTPRCIGTTSSYGKPSLDTIFHICNVERWQRDYKSYPNQPITVEGVTLASTQFFTGECQSDIYVITEDKNEVIVCDSAGWKTLNSVSEAQAYMLKHSPCFNLNDITNKEDFDL